MKLTQLLNEIKVIKPSRVLFNLIVPDSEAKIIMNHMKGKEIIPLGSMPEFFKGEIEIRLKEIDKPYKASFKFRFLSEDDPEFTIVIYDINNRRHYNMIIEVAEENNIEYTRLMTGIKLDFKKDPNQKQYISINGIPLLNNYYK